LALARAGQHPLHSWALAAFGAVLAVVSVETLSVLSGLRTLAALATVGEMAYLLTPAAGLAYIVAAQLVKQQPASTRARPTQPTQAAQPDADQPETQPAYTLNGRGPK